VSILHLPHFRERKRTYSSHAPLYFDRKTANNFNAVMAKNARLTIVEAEEIVDVGQLDPASVHVPSIYVDRIIQSESEKLRIEKVTMQAQHSAVSAENTPGTDKRDTICRRAAQLLTKDHQYVNLGIGMPMTVPNFLDQSKSVYLQSENGLLGMGPYPSTREEVDADLINAGKETVTLHHGGSYFDSAESFAMIRGGHIDYSMLGAMQVSAVGDLANFLIPNKLVKGMGGAADLVSSPDKTHIIALTEHNARDGSPKIVEQCSLPLTGSRCVSTIVTELAIFHVDRHAGENGLTLVEMVPGVTVEEVRRRTGASFQVRLPL
jgi:3-oxoacid CoA-transferase